MAKAKILKIPARGDWEFVEVETEADGNLPLETTPNTEDSRMDFIDNDLDREEDEYEGED